MPPVSVNEATGNLQNWVDKAVDGEVVQLTVNGEKRAVLVGMEQLLSLMGFPQNPKKKDWSSEQWSENMRASFQEAGYNTPEEIVNLIKEVRKEIYEEKFEDGEA